MSWSTLWHPLLWALNGLLAVLYLLAENWTTLLLIPGMAWLAVVGPLEHRPWVLGIAGVAVLASLLTPQPIPLLLLAMTGAACVVLKLEKFNPGVMHWRAISGIALYALVGCAVTGFQWYVENQAVANPMFSSGQGYITIIASIALYGIPLGFLALLAQGMFVHPPIPGGDNPSGLINALRARKQD